MASIQPTPIGTTPPLAGIVSSVPQPTPSRTSALGSGGHFVVAPLPQATLGGGSPTQPPLPGTSDAPVGSHATIGGGGTAAAGTPGVGAQPTGPQPALPGAATPPAPGITVANPAAPAPAAGTPAPTPMPTPIPDAAAAPAVMTTGAAAPLSGFGKAERAMPMKVAVDGATFTFPSFKQTARSNTAPPIKWGPGWKRVDTNGMWYMQHSNGAKAIPAVEFRMTPSPVGKVSTVKVANGWGKKFPDGTILVFDRNEGAYRLDSAGEKHKVPLGTHSFGGVKVRVFEVSVVRTLEKSGSVTVFDSRGSYGAGSTRGRVAAGLATANAGAALAGGGATKAAGPTDKSGKSAPGTTVSATKPTAAQVTADVQRLTAVARGLLDQVRSGATDPAKLAALQAQLGTLPAGILQAAGAAGTMSSDGRTMRHAGETHALPVSSTAGVSGAGAPVPTTPAPTMMPPSATPAPTPPPGTTVAAGPTVVAPGAIGGGAPTAGVDANAAEKTVAAGAAVKLGMQVPTDMVGKQARFAQLPAAVQQAIATAFGSTEGMAALKADQLVAFSASGDVSLVGGGTVFVKHVPQVRGAGPGEDLAVTVRPARQPGSTGTVGDDTQPSAMPTVNRPAVGTPGTVPMMPPMINAPGTTVAGGGGTSRKIPLFRPGQSIRSVDFGGINGSFTWKTLPAKAKAAVLNFLKTQTSDPAAKAFASRAGSGWTFDPSATIVVDAGFASFVSGMSMTRRASTSGGGGATTAVRPPAPGGLPSSANAVRPPVIGGGSGIGTVPPGTPPPLPAMPERSGAHGSHRH